MTGPGISVEEGALERDVIRRARAGSLPAYDEVMRRYEQRVLGFLLRRCSNRQDAEDLVQETFLRAWQRLHLYDERWAFSTWILTVAARLCATHHRRRLGERPSANVADRPTDEAPPADAAAHREAGQNVWLLAERLLSAEQRSALWLRYADDMAINDIARVLGKSAVATRVLLFRARAALAPHLQEGHVDPSPADRAAAPARVARPRPEPSPDLALTSNSGGA